MGDSKFMTREQVKAAFAARDAARKAEQQEFLREANANKAFHQNQYALVRSMKSTIERANKERWGNNIARNRRSQSPVNTLGPTFGGDHRWRHG